MLRVANDSLSYKGLMLKMDKAIDATLISALNSTQLTRQLTGNRCTTDSPMR
jgi:hypothetical protein